MREQGWGSALGDPGIVLDPDGPEVAVDVFESGDLPADWERREGVDGYPVAWILAGWSESGSGGGSGSSRRRRAAA